MIKSPSIEVRKSKLGLTDIINQAAKSQTRNLNKKVTGAKIINDH